jgi:hypothetical protein
LERAAYVYFTGSPRFFAYVVEEGTKRLLAAEMCTLSELAEQKWRDMNADERRSFYVVAQRALATYRTHVPGDHYQQVKGIFRDADSDICTFAFPDSIRVST